MTFTGDYPVCKKCGTKTMPGNVKTTRHGYYIHKHCGIKEDPK